MNIKKKQVNTKKCHIKNILLVNSVNIYVSFKRKKEKTSNTRVKLPNRRNSNVRILSFRSIECLRESKILGVRVKIAVRNIFLFIKKRRIKKIIQHMVKYCRTQFGYIYDTIKETLVLGTTL